jgi:hypothetical protein
LIERGNSLPRVFLPSRPRVFAIEPTAHVDLGQFVRSHASDGAALARGAMQSVIVDDHGNSVFRKLNIELNSICSVVDRLSESCQSVLRRDR